MMRKVVLVLLVAVVLYWVTIFASVACGTPIYPFDTQTKLGDEEFGVILSIEEQGYVSSPPPLPTFGGAYIFEIETANGIIERCADSHLGTVPKEGDWIKGTTTLYKSRFDKDWKEWRPFENYTYPSYAIWWRNVEVER